MIIMPTISISEENRSRLLVIREQLGVGHTFDDAVSRVLDRFNTLETLEGP